MTKLLLATNNSHKVAEYQSLLRDIPYELVTPEQVGIRLVVDETGTTMEENATLKAVSYAKLSRLLTFADDSGLEVDVLDGAPGVVSARYAGEHASNESRIAKLLSKMKDVPREKRAARFRCVIALALTGEEIEMFPGECYGVIALEPRGTGGFGYDPVFYLPSLGKTMAELSPEEKNRVSHRGQAARKLRSWLEKIPLEIGK